MLDKAIYSNTIQWPEGFMPPPKAIKVEKTEEEKP
jgi:hypothetical protein